MKALMEFVAATRTKPPLYEPGEPRFWDDPHISKEMLEAHLNPDHDVASRRPQIIDATARYLFGSGILRPGMRVLDLGCGPGLYAQKFTEMGAKVTGLDISRRSVEYARTCASRAGLDIEYYVMNFLDMDYSGDFDAAIQVYGELNTFSDAARDHLLRRVHAALRPNGTFIFDVTTRALRMKEGLRNKWRVSDAGFWRPGRHLVLEQGFDYPENDVWLDQYVVIDEGGYKVYRNWFHDYSLATLKPVLEAGGFKVASVWNDLTGTPYSEGGDWIAVAAQRTQ